jgi:hypothetical protein
VAQTAPVRQSALVQHWPPVMHELLATHGRMALLPHSQIAPWFWQYSPVGQSANVQQEGPGALQIGPGHSQVPTTPPSAQNKPPSEGPPSESEPPSGPASVSVPASPWPSSPDASIDPEESLVGESVIEASCEGPPAAFPPHPPKSKAIASKPSRIHEMVALTLVSAEES